MYLATLVAFTLGEPWKKPFYTNKIFMVVLIIIVTYSILIVVVPASRISDFQIDYMSDNKLNGFVVGLALAFAFGIFILQKLIW
jgi:hypothetical protein